MDILIEQLDHKLRAWTPETANEVRSRLGEIIEMADMDSLDISRSRSVEQEVLDMIDDAPSR